MKTIDTLPSAGQVEDLAALLDDEEEAPCNRADAAAVANLVVRCCGASYLVCARHLKLAQRRTERAVFLCATCGTPYVRRPFDDIYRVVAL